MVNPTSFSQTVENLFYCAFLAKEGKLAVETLEDGDALIYATESDENEEGATQAVERFQHMLSLDMESYRVHAQYVL